MHAVQAGTKYPVGPKYASKAIFHNPFPDYTVLLFFHSNPIPIRFGMEAIWEEKSISVITLAEAPGSILQTAVHDRKTEIGVRREM
jgi:hypothetical protein